MKHSNNFRCPYCNDFLYDGAAFDKKVILIDDEGHLQKWISKIKCWECKRIFTYSNEYLTLSGKQTNPKNNDLDYIKSIIQQQEGSGFMTIFGKQIWDDGYFYHWDFKPPKIKNDIEKADIELLGDTDADGDVEADGDVVEVTELVNGRWVVQ